MQPQKNTKIIGLIPFMERNPCKTYCKPESYWTEISLNNGRNYIKTRNDWRQ